jgi:hypothetical protein
MAAELDEDTDSGVDQINDWIYRANREQSLTRYSDISPVLSAGMMQLRRYRSDLIEVGRYPGCPITRWWRSSTRRLDIFTKSTSRRCE